ncbi:MAG TPA: hypothetical protein VN370_02070 [Desulfitobacteriaceae bacterium]|nr:hypothetical protein [Desulfitobacteriaceae bacterium]
MSRQIFDYLKLGSLFLIAIEDFRGPVYFDSLLYDTYTFTGHPSPPPKLPKLMEKKLIFLRAYRQLLHLQQLRKYAESLKILLKPHLLKQLYRMPLILEVFEKADDRFSV